MAQAGDFFHQLVRNFSFKPFTVPERIREHAKSQPIKTDMCEDVSLNLSVVSESSDDTDENPINKKERKVMPQPRLCNIATALPRRYIPNNRRERRVDPSKNTDKMVDSDETDFELEEKMPKVGRRKLTFQVVQETDDFIETIPHVVSAGTLGTLSAVQKPAKCRAFGQCSNETQRNRSPQVRLNLERNDLMSIDDAKESFLERKGRNGEESRTDLSFPIHVNSFGEEVINITLSREFEFRSINDRFTNEEQKDDQVSDIDDGDDSDAESMVPLKHGIREKLATLSREKPQEGRANVSRSVLAASDESSALVWVASDKGTLSKDLSENTPAEHETKPTVLNSQLNSLHFVPDYDELHRQELKLKIKEFQQRKQGAQETPITLIGSSIAGSSRPPAVQLPKASRKIAQAYVDALKRKYTEESGDSPAAKVVTSSNQYDSQQGDVKKPIVTVPVTNALFDSMTVTTLGYSTTGTTVGTSGETVSRLPPVDPVGTVASSRDVDDVEADFKRESFDVCKAFESEPESKTTTSISSMKEEVPVDVDGIVCRIDSMMQKLVDSGKLTSMDGGSEEKAKVREDTAELLQNLAVLRARERVGGSNASRSHRGTSFGTEVSTSTLDDSKTAQSAPGESIRTVSVFSGTNSQVVQSYRNIQELRERRDRAALIVRDTSRRLTDWAKDSTQPNSERKYNTEQNSELGRTVHISDQSSRSESQRGPHVHGRSFEQLMSSNKIVMSKHEHKVGLTKEFSTEPSISVVTSDWEREQLEELPVLLMPSFSAVHEGGRHNVSAAPSGECHESAFDIGTNGLVTTDVSTLGDDSAFDDELQQIARIERMIQHIRANRSRC
jgi:hypothetical protein